MKLSQPSQPSTPIVYLCLCSAIIVFSYNVLFDKTLRDDIMTTMEDRGIITKRGLRVVATNTNKRKSGEEPTWFESAIPGEVLDRQRRLEIDDYVDKRIAEVFAETWPICVDMRWTSFHCKAYIEDQILSTFTGQDQHIRVVIRNKRNIVDPWYHAVVIYMSDNDMAVGRNGDGWIYYDFKWDGTGVLATPEQQKEIPPVLATETDPTDPATSDPTSPEYQPLVIEYSPTLVVGASVVDAVARNTTDPIAGGIVVDSTVSNTVEGDARLNSAIQSAGMASIANIDDGTVNEVPLPEAGQRTLMPFNCDGLTAYNCCLLIKLKVRDSDFHGNSIQCQLMYAPGTSKEEYRIVKGPTGKVVPIYANHNDIVSKIPQIVGEWPEA